MAVIPADMLVLSSIPALPLLLALLSVLSSSPYPLRRLLPLPAFLAMASLQMLPVDSVSRVPWFFMGSRIGLDPTSNLFLFFAPLEAWRHIKVTERRTMVDFAFCMRDLVDIHFPNAEKIVLVMDNLNTHKLASLYEAFAPAEARRIAEKLEIHYTPKHGSWLNMAEIELSVLHRQSLNARIPDQPTLIKRVAAWQQKRNDASATVNWRFTTADARIKLRRLDPAIDVC